MNRRDFVVGAASSAAVLGSVARSSAGGRSTGNFTYCAFVKFIQSLSYDELAEKMAECGFAGIEATVRERGLIEPVRAEEDLPKLVEALKKRGLEITIMASDINQADDSLSQKVLRTAAGLGVKKYRMKYYRYDLNKPILPQLDGLKPRVKELAALNRELGIGAVFQNHSGARNVGATLWDLQRLMEGIDPQVLGVAFDIRHATVEGGLAWPMYFQMIQPHLAAIYLKDYRWNGRRPENTPLGEGQVDPQFYDLVKKSEFRGPVSIHVEYLGEKGVSENVAALKRDLAIARKHLGNGK